MSRAESNASALDIPSQSRSIRYAVGKAHSQLGVDQAPVLPPAGPFFRNIHHVQIQHFSRLSSVGKTDFDLVTFRSCRLKPSIALIV